MAKQLIIFTKEELLKLLDGSPVRMESSEDLQRIFQRLYFTVKMDLISLKNFGRRRNNVH